MDRSAKGYVILLRERELRKRKDGKKCRNTRVAMRIIYGRTLFDLTQ